MKLEYELVRDDRVWRNEKDPDVWTQSFLCNQWLRSNFELPKGLKEITLKVSSRPSREAIPITIDPRPNTHDWRHRINGRPRDTLLGMDKAIRKELTKKTKLHVSVEY